MLIPPKYILTQEISKLLSSIESSKEVINSITIPPEIEINIRRSSTLRSSLFSARIEGNPLTLDKLSSTPSKDQKKKEVYNILKALNLINQRTTRDIALKQILELHEIVMEDLAEKSQTGKFRTQVNAIFNSAGIAIYMPPPPSQITSLLNRLIAFVNGRKEQFIPTQAVLVHFIFEKIHPFMDGNGRVGRLLLQAVLHKNGYGMKGLLALEEQLDEKRSVYYRALEDTERDVTDYVELMLSSIAIAAEKAKNEVMKKQKLEVTDYLLPRRAEIYNIIKDHQLVNFDQIRRRFIAVNERTLRYDLKKLQDAGLIKKLGTTKGVYYELLKKL